MTKAEMRDRIALLEQIAMGTIRVLKRQELVGEDDVRLMMERIGRNVEKFPRRAKLAEFFTEDAMQMFAEPTRRKLGDVALRMIERRAFLDEMYRGEE